jgi:hypothetical protein
MSDLIYTSDVHIERQARPLLARLSGRLLAALIFFSACAVTSAQQAAKTGPEVGSTLPAFEASDQNGRPQNLQTILGPKGALLVFYRSADW